MADLTTTNDLVSNVSSTTTTTSTSAAVTRLAKLAAIEEAALNATPNTAVGVVSVSDAVLSAAIMTTSSSLPPANQVGITQPIGYKFNLPPHDWSLPIRPVTVDPAFVGRTLDSSFHGLRRGRIWYWAGVNNLNNAAEGESAATSTVDTAWGFQFLWNPTNISTNVSRNMDITPSNADALRVVAGVFPGQETVNLSLIIDRTNDFACIRAAAAGNYNEFSRYYNSSYPGSGIQDMGSQIINLMGQGTMADLEYLFKAINGSGNGTLQWSNLLGKQTANVGYLAPTLLGIQLGPTLNNLSYVGWVSNVSLNHTAFTENMIPIRTEVGISIQCFAGSGLTSGE
jgi:hypothetical protein